MTDWKRLLEACESEQLHLTGAIQPHGYLVHLSLPDLRVLHVSANLVALLGRSPAEVLGRPAREWMRDFDPAAFLGSRPGGSRPLALFALRLGGRSHHAVPFRSAEGCVVEFHPASAIEDGPGYEPPWGMDGADPADPAQAWDAAATEVRSITGLDRVMIYRFADDGSGEVVGESLADGVDGYLGLRFPASDIPQIARALYAQNPSRHIPDVDAAPAPLLAADPGRGPLDLGPSDLRSVSPVHLQYLRNMGVRSSFSASIRVEGRLWGLVACHHREPRTLPVTRQLRAAGVAQLLGLHLARLEAGQAVRALESADRAVARVSERIGRSESVEAGIVESRREVLELVGASGGAFLQGDRCVRLGETPGEAGVRAIAAFCAGAATDGVFATDHLAGAWPAGKAHVATASGVIAIQAPPGERRDGATLLWFRPEVVRTVKWAGDGSKGIVTVEGREVLTPRTSFAAWSETRREHGAPWSRVDLLAARRFRSHVLRWAQA